MRGAEARSKQRGNMAVWHAAYNMVWAAYNVVWAACNVVWAGTPVWRWRGPRRGSWAEVKAALRPLGHGRGCMGWE